MVTISSMNCSPLSSPRSISKSLFSHSAVSPADFKFSGITRMSSLPSAVGMICFPFRCAYPDATSFSMVLALVAGVPSPFFSVFSSNSLLPAVSIAARSVSSLNDFGGEV